MTWQLAGALGFGLLLGWNVYFVNRYRRGDISFGDIATLVGVVGGAAVLALYPNGSDLFGAYGVGLGIGFFAYFVSLLILVRKSHNFDWDWFLDGRRRNPETGWGYAADTRPTMSAMALRPAGADAAPNVAITFHGTNPAEAALALQGGATASLSAPNPNALKIQQACLDVWSGSGPNGPYKSACNFYAIEVADRLGVDLSGTADHIVDVVKADGSWTALADGKAARDAAAQGQFVIAGVRSDAYAPPRDMGHVAIVTPGAMNPAGWAPAGYWGSVDAGIAALGGSGMPISNCFSSTVKDKVVYRARAI